MDHYFSGSALGSVDRNGRVALPGFVRSVLARRTGGDALLFGRHEADPCLIGYDRSRIPQLAAELERRRLRDEAEGLDAVAHHARARRLFGLASEASVDGRGRVLLPELERRRLAIAGHALFIGTGAAFEVWSLERACTEAGEVAEIARFHPEQAGLSAAA
jgi:DNA-binding transcriptional regulator/RsmH inhibitor MraZ